MNQTTIHSSYSKYPTYKDSGVEWLGDVPVDWECLRMKRLYRDFSKKNMPNAELLSVTQNQGVIPRSWVENRMVMPNGALESFKLIEEGDFAISLRSFEGGLEYCHHDGIISPAYTVLKKRRTDLDERYYKYLFKSFSFISELQTSVVGIREGKNISYPELSYSFLPIPSPCEQTAIARFLDDKTAKIDQAIAQKEKLIALLKERKQIMIQELVTGKKIWNGSAWTEPVEVKDSGVEWIGEIPEHWEVMKLPYLTKLIVDGTHFSPKSFDTGEYKYITAKNIKVHGFDLSDISYVSKLAHDLIYPRCPVKKGDVLYIKDGATAGIAMVNNLDEEFSLLSSVALIRTRSEKLLPVYLKHYLNSSLIVSFIKTQIVGGALTRLTLQLIGKLQIILPSGKEQEILVY
jgi:type I restriction enzyme, S subunit